mmetsp:Transcript_2366/g.3276  ORF Transcript_2366/g.3276 Transcript_2366/m.3276 type:complete len:681 (-) Transcript_2366:305-2347(-)
MMMLEGPWMGGGGNLTVEEAACEWLRTTDVDWSQWLSVTLPNTVEACETYVSNDGFSHLEVALMVISLVLFAELIGRVLFTKLISRNKFKPFSFKYNAQDIEEQKPLQHFESPVETAVIMLSDMLEFKKKIARESTSTLRENSSRGGSHVRISASEKNNDNEYSEEGILYLLGLQNDGRKSIHRISSNVTDSTNASDLRDDVVEKLGDRHAAALSVHEALQDLSQPWTRNITAPSHWDFFGAFTRIDLVLNRKDVTSTDLENGELNVHQQPNNIGKDLTFDTVAAVPRCNKEPLAILGMFLIDEHFDLVNRLGLDPLRLWNFLVEVESGYQASNPYHNSTHAVDVTQRFATLLTKCRLRDRALSDLEVLAGLTAALVHDYLHPGTNNAFQVATGAPVAILHNNRHVLENHSAMRGLLLLKGGDNETNFISRLPRVQRRRVRDIVIEMILATDMSEHFDVLSSFKSKVLPKMQASTKTTIPKEEWNVSTPPDSKDGKMPVVPNSASKTTPERDLLSPEERVVLLRMALKCADIGHVTLPLQAHMMWVKSLQEEFYRQGDKEHELEVQISFLCDRRKARNGPAYGENQLGFLDVIAFPLYAAWVEAFPSCSVLLENLRRNRRNWEVDAMRNGSNVFKMSIDEIPVSNIRKGKHCHTFDGADPFIGARRKGNNNFSFVDLTNV